MPTKGFPQRGERNEDAVVEDVEEYLFEVFADASPEQAIEAVELMLVEPWHTDADTPFEHRIGDISITSSDDVDLHEIELLRSPDFFDDSTGELHAAVLEQAEPVANTMERAAREAWGEPAVVQISDDPHACTVLDVVLTTLDHTTALAWQREGRYIALLRGQGDKELRFMVTFLVLSRAAVEDAVFDLTGEAPQVSAVEGRLAATLPPGAVLPEQLGRAWSFMESQGWSGQGANGEPFLTPYPGEFQLGPVFSADLSIRGWLDPDAPGAERLVPIAETDGSGGQALLWFDDSGAPRFVGLSSEGDEAVRLADDPVDFLRLVAIGYPEFVDYAFGAEPDAFDDEDESDGQDSKEAHARFRAWVESEFEVTVPRMWEVHPDREFQAWLRPLADEHGLGLE